MKNKESLTNMYVTLFDRLPPLLETRDYEEDFYQNLMSEAIINDQPITEETIEMALKSEGSKYDYIDSKPKKEEITPEMETKKIRELLKRYGADDNEIENFMQDLGEAKEFNYLDYVEKLKLTEEGKDLIEKAPSMAKDQLEKAVKDLLDNNK